MNYAIAYTGGILTFLAPCGTFLLPAFFAYAFGDVKKLMSRALFFLGGLLIALLPLGYATGSVGAFLQTYMGTITMVIASLIILSGILQILSVKIPTIPLPGFITNKSAGNTSAIGIFALGISYGLAGVGCTGPILGAVLSTALTTGSGLAGTIMMFWYALGMFTPIFLLTLIWQRISSKLQSKFRPHPITVFGRSTTIGSLISGIIFVILGLFLFTIKGVANFFAVTASTQTHLEGQVQKIFAGIPNWAIVGGVILAGVFLWATVMAFRQNTTDSSPIS